MTATAGATDADTVNTETANAAMSDPSGVPADHDVVEPLGVFPLPAGYLLVGPRVSHEAVRQALLSGRRPTHFPATLRFYEQALDGDENGALASLRAMSRSGMSGGDEARALANELVLDPTASVLARARDGAAHAGEPAIAQHVELVAFATGLRRDPPDPAGHHGVLRVMALAARASLALSRKDIAAATDDLEEAAQLAMTLSPPLAGQLLGQLAHLQLDDGGVKRAQVTFQAAIDALSGTDLRVSTAELHVAAGAMFQEMSEAAPRLLKQAIEHYHAALQLVDAATAPESFAIANANLGLAYLTMPMTQASDQLRVGLAVQSMREALKVFTPEAHPDRWSSTQLNLANALVYMPSTHQADNIAEAVELYEAVLQVRDRHRDPHGRARVLANQGNALAHLGVFGDAKLRLHEARAIFEEFEEHEAVRSVRSVLDEIAKHESLLRQDRAAEPA